MGCVVMTRRGRIPATDRCNPTSKREMLLGCSSAVIATGRPTQPNNPAEHGNLESGDRTVCSNCGKRPHRSSTTNVAVHFLGLFIEHF